MAGHQTYEEQKALVFKGLMLLGAITIVEVFIALLAKGHLIHGVEFKHGFGHYLYMALMVGFSIYKAYFIVFYFMHMAYELRGLVLSVLLPVTLLIWAIIAFFQEGSAWGARRELIKEKNEEVVQPAPAGKPTGYLLPGASYYKG
ncbi:MAG TPA: cytochrome C oxidase subunit IV family protein [Saprospiraceae bacterium]|nr:cytochrome C oxidase subunit IV family protein [Saprospiraceae bacterium]HPI07350.1 cytochrome C oxidase subunit IV family protein [Saprospiraceae bacterium]